MLQLKDPSTRQIREFLVRKQFQEVDFHCRIQVQQNKKRFLLFRFSKKVLRERDLQKHLNSTITKINSLSHSSVSKTEGILQDTHYIYVIIVDDMLVTLSQLLQKRQRLTQFQIKYFIAQLYYSLNHLKSKGFIFLKLSMQNITLDSSVKINFGFSLWISQIANLTKVRRTMKLNHKGLQSSCDSDDPQKIILWEIALIYYHFLEGQPLISNGYHRKQINNKRIRLKYINENSQPYLLLKKMLFNKQFKFNDLMYESILKNNVPKVLPQSILFCPPSKKFQQDIVKTIRLQQSLKQKKTIKRIQSQQQNNKQQLTQQNEQNNQIVFVDDFCDITAKFGYGYKMSNGSIGFYFNDRTLLLLLEDGSNRQIRYFDQNWVQKIYKQDKLIDQHDIKKKLHILQAFRRAVCQFKKSNSTFNKIVYIKNYVKVKNARLFLLSNNTCQAKFIDNTQILCLSSNSSLYFDKKAQQFTQISQQDSQQIQIRQTYTKQLSIKLFDWLKAMDDKQQFK